MKKFIALTSLVLAVTACGKSSSNDNNTPAVSADAGAGVTPVTPVTPAPGEGATVVDPSTGTGTVPAVEAPAVLVELQVDATDKVNFAHLDLDSGKIVAATDASWDLAFKRTVIKQNTDVTTAVIQDSTFDAALPAAATGNYLADAPVAGGVETASLVFHAGLSWYTYDMSVHVINTNNFVYFVKANSGATYKLSIKDYYDLDRLPAFIQLQYIKVSSANTTTAAAE